MAFFFFLLRKNYTARNLRCFAYFLNEKKQGFVKKYLKKKTVK